MQRIPESNCATKETVVIDILITSRSGDKNQATCQNNEWTYHEMEPGSATRSTSSDEHLPN